MTAPANLIAPMIGAGSCRSAGNLWKVANCLGLHGNLKLCFDIAAIECVPTSGGQTVLDLSPQGTNFYRGTTSGVDTNDPTFVGTPGDLSAGTYYSADGGDWFDYTGGVAPAWFQAGHKPGGASSMLAWVYIPGNADASPVSPIISTHRGSYGIYFGTANGTRKPYLGVNSGVWTADANVSIGWHLMGYAFSDASNSGFMYVDGAYAQVGGANEFAYTHEVASDAFAYTWALFAIQQAGYEVPNGTRLGGILVWDTKLSKAQMDMIFTTTKGRYGL